MRAHALVVAFAVAVTGGSAAVAAELTKQAVNAASFEEGQAIPSGERSPLVFKLQALLDRANISPGVLDGYWGENVEKALVTFRDANELGAGGELDTETWEALGGGGADPVLVDYEIAEEDLEGPFVDRIPADWREQAEMERLAHTGPAEMLAERFHMEIGALRALNPDAAFGESGTTIVVAAVRESGPAAEVARIEADKRRAQVRGYDSRDGLVVAYPATIGSDRNPSPSGTWEVARVALDPTYHYMPDENFQIGGIEEPLVLPPGPNNPVGTVWIDLGEEGYGIHGTPEPAQIDKQTSHGCVRLTNWDAEELAGLVEAGTKVEFVE